MKKKVFCFLGPFFEWGHNLFKFLSAIGRQFFKCAKPQGSGCDYFLWASSDGNNSTAAQPPPPRNTNNSNSNQNRQNDWGNNYNAQGPSTSWSNNSNFNASGDNVNCTCGQPAKK